jgi:hypothetical protein
MGGLSGPAPLACRIHPACGTLSRAQSTLSMLQPIPAIDPLHWRSNGAAGRPPAPVFNRLRPPGRPCRCLAPFRVIHVRCGAAMVCVGRPTGPKQPCASRVKCQSSHVAHVAGGLCFAILSRPTRWHQQQGEWNACTAQTGSCSPAAPPPCSAGPLAPLRTSPVERREHPSRRSLPHPLGIPQAKPQSLGATQLLSPRPT